MATVFVNGVFDLLHDGHKEFLMQARALAISMGGWHDQVVAAINSDRYARKLKGEKWGPGYPIDDQFTRAIKIRHYVNDVRIFDNEEQLYALIGAYAPCILCKGPDYAGRKVTGDDLCQVMILNSPEPQSAKLLKREKYGLVGSAVDRSTHIVPDPDQQ
jgi:cytidyltransferase-like protein